MGDGIGFFVLGIIMIKVFSGFFMVSLLEKCVPIGVRFAACRFSAVECLCSCSLPARDVSREGINVGRICKLNKPEQLKILMGVRFAVCRFSAVECLCLCSLQARDVSREGISVGRMCRLNKPEQLKILMGVRFCSLLV